MDLKLGPVLTFAHGGLPALLNFSQDGAMLASQTLWDQRMLLWDVGTGQLFFDVPGFLGQACDAGRQGEFYFLSHQGTEALFSEITAGTCRSLAVRFGCSVGLLVSCVNQSRWSNRGVFQPQRLRTLGPAYCTPIARLAARGMPGQF